MGAGRRDRAGRSCSPVWSSRSRSTSRSPNRSRPNPPSPSQNPSPRPPSPRRHSPSRDHEGSLDAGLERTRGGFMSRLRGFLVGGPEGPSWDDVEETLIAGDVGAALAMDVVERARRRRDPAGAESAVRAELAALLVPRDPDWAPKPSVEGGPAVDPRRRRQRHRQDHQHRQAREPVCRGGAPRDPRGGGHVPGRGHRPAAHLGGPGRHRDGRARARRGPRRGRLRRARRGRRPRRGPRDRRHGRSPAHEVEPDGRALEDPPHHRQAAARRGPRDAGSCSMPPPARTA